MPRIFTTSHARMAFTFFVAGLISLPCFGDAQKALQDGEKALEEWKAGTDTKLIGRPLRELVAQDDHVLEAMVLLMKMHEKLVSEYLDEIPGLDYNSDESIEKSPGVRYALEMGDIDKAIPVLIREAWLLNTEAIMLLDISFNKGIEGWPDTDERVYNFFRDYANEGFPRGKYIYGKHLLRKTGEVKKAIRYLDESGLPDAHMEAFWWFAEEEKNWNRSVDFARSAAELGDVTGLYELGIYSQEAEEYEAMAGYFKEALDIDPEYIPAQLELARAYIHGLGVAEDEKRGAEMMLELTNAPDEEIQAIASLNMAVFYAKGVGVEPSKLLAEEYLKKAKNLGYDVPEGIQSIVDEADDKTFDDFARILGDYTIENLSEQASNGDSVAQYKLAMLYYEGYKIGKDKVRAMKLLSSAAQDEIPGAETMLGSIYMSDDEVGIDYDKALFWSIKGTEHGDPIAASNVGTLYLDGLGVEKNPKKAFEYYKLSALRGNAYSQYLIAQMYLNGMGVSEDLVMALAWFEILSDEDADSRELAEQIKQVLSEGDIARARRMTKDIRTEIRNLNSRN